MTDITKTGTMPPQPSVPAQLGSGLIADSSWPFLTSLAVNYLVTKKPQSLYTFGVALGFGVLGPLSNAVGLSQSAITGFPDRLVWSVVAGAGTWCLFK